MTQATRAAAAASSRAEASAAPSALPDAVTAPQGPRGRRVLGWALGGLALLLVAFIALAVQQGAVWVQKEPLDPRAAGPRGSLAVAELLRQQGVDVDVTTSRAEAQTRAHGATLVIPRTSVLSDEALESLASEASELVLLSPDARQLRLLAAGTIRAGVGEQLPVAATCELPEARRAGSIVPGELYSPADGASGCFPQGDGFGLVTLSDGGRRIWVLDGAAVLSNENLPLAGHAALALNVLGHHERLVWYVPTFGDSDLADTSLGAQTPGWVTPALVLAALTGLVAAFVAGRRFGPLVFETLPVTVRASETMEGRARLYARSHDASHAAAILRSAARERLARVLGLPARASTDEVSSAAAALLGLPTVQVSDILAGPAPADDRALVSLSDRIRTLEAAIAHALRPATTSAERTQND